MKKSKMRDLNKRLDDKKYDTEINISKINYDGDGFCGVTSKHYPRINDVKPLVKTNFVPNDDIEINAKTNYDGDGFCGFTSKNYPKINDVKPSVKTDLIPNYDAKINDVNPLEKTDYDDGVMFIACFAASPLIVNIDLLLETIPKVDAKLEAEKNNTAIDIAGKVGFDSNDSFNGTLTECRPDATSDLPNIVMIDFDALNRTLTECRPDASNLPNIVMIDNADTPITDFIVM